jgi:hypothetical protein
MLPEHKKSALKYQGGLIIDIAFSGFARLAGRPRLPSRSLYRAMLTCPFCSKYVPSGSIVCPHCLRALPAATAPAPRKPGSPLMTAMYGRWRAVLLLLGLAGVGFYYVRQHRGDYQALVTRDPVVPDATPPVTPITIAQPLDVAIADSASAKIEGGKYLAFPFSGDGRSECRIAGRVRVLSGGDRHVNVFIVDRDGMTELQAGRAPRTYYESGATSDVTLHFNVDGRTTYTLVVANTTPRGRAKAVRLQGIKAACSD